MKNNSSYKIKSFYECSTADNGNVAVESTKQVYSFDEISPKIAKRQDDVHQQMQ